MLILTRGLPGSGKTTWARGQLGGKDAVRVNRDDLRKMLHGGWKGDRISEEQVTKAQHTLLMLFLFGGQTVICDDTNLSPKTVAELSQIAEEAGVKVKIVDFTYVPLATCIARDAARENPVGEEVIRRMHTRYLHKGHTEWRVR